MNPERQYYLDWLRMLAILGVLFFHSAMPYVAEESWHIKNEETSNLLMEFNYWLSRFRMPLLFFVSGAVTHFILKRKTGLQFVGLRFKRLVVPLIFGMLIIVPPQVYLERINQGFSGSYFDFYPSILSGESYPKGNTSWHHLWFIAYLFIYNLITVPFFASILSPKNNRVAAALGWFARGPRFLLLAIPGVAWFTAFVFSYSQTNDLVHDYAFFPYWFFFFLAGYLCITGAGITASIEKYRRLSLLLAFISLIMINYGRWNNLEPWDSSETFRNDWQSYAIISLRAITAWCWVFAIIGYGRKYLNRPSRLLGYINESVYPFYIIHQTVIVILSFYIVKTTDTIILKYIFTVIVSFMLTMFILHLLIRPSNILRFLFGMGPIKTLEAGKVRAAKSHPEPGVAAAINNN